MNKIRTYQYKNQVKTISHFDLYVEGTNFAKRARELSYPMFTIYELEQRAIDLFNKEIKINALLSRTKSFNGSGSQNQCYTIASYLYKHMREIKTDVKWLNSKQVRYPIPEIEKDIETIQSLM